MPKFNNINVYDIMLSSLISNRKILKAQYNEIKNASSIFTLKHYEKRINDCNRFIKAIKNAKKNQIIIDNLSKNLYH